MKKILMMLLFTMFFLTNISFAQNAHDNRFEYICSSTSFDDITITRDYFLDTKTMMYGDAEKNTVVVIILSKFNQQTKDCITDMYNELKRKGQNVSYNNLQDALKDSLITYQFDFSKHSAKLIYFIKFDSEGNETIVVDHRKDFLDSPSIDVSSNEALESIYNYVNNYMKDHPDQVKAINSKVK